MQITIFLGNFFFSCADNLDFLMNKTIYKVHGQIGYAQFTHHTTLK